MNQAADETLTPPGLAEEPEIACGPSVRGGPLRRGVREGVSAARANLRPAAALWAVGLAILGAYYHTDWGRAGLERVASVREAYGLVYAMLATAVFGGVIPWLVMKSRRVTRQRATLGLLAFMSAVWMEKGIEVSLLYDGLAWLVGDTNDLGVIAAKVALDQGLYAPLYAAPTLLLLYRWHDAGYRFEAFKAALSKRWWLDRALPVIMANSAVWTPTVVMIYALPLALQLPMQNLVLCFWSLILMFMADPAKESGA